VIEAFNYNNQGESMEVNEMKSEKKEMIKNFKVVIKDLLDNYEKYTDEEKARIKDLFRSVAELNSILDKYDVETKFSFADYIAACSQYFDAIR
jgi:predicted methyltransferase